LVLIASPSFCAQSSSISGPVLGFAPDSGGDFIRPILGIPGASILGQRLEFESDIRTVGISPKQDYVVAIRQEDAQLLVIPLRSGSFETIPVSGTYPGERLFTISPTGSVVGVYELDTRAVRLIGELPGSPGIIAEFDASMIPGRGTELTASDDGAFAL